MSLQVPVADVGVQARRVLCQTRFVLGVFLFGVFF